MAVASVVVGLPDINQGVLQGFTIYIQHPTTHQNRFTEGDFAVSFQQGQVDIGFDVLIDRVKGAFHLGRCHNA